MATLDEVLQHLLETDLKEKPLQNGDLVCYVLNNAAVVIGASGSDISIQAVLEEPVRVDMELDTDNCQLDPDTIDRLAESIIKPPAKRPVHQLYTPQDCPYDHDVRPGNCPVCDGGLSICKVCGKAEVELDQECTPSPSSEQH